MSLLRYAKRGTTSRVEALGSVLALHEITEEGIAVEDGIRFSASSGETRLRPPEPAVSPGELRERCEPLLRCRTLQRLVIASGSASHRLDSDGHQTLWSDSSARLHVELLPTSPLQRTVTLDASDEAIAGIADEIMRIEQLPSQLFTAVPSRLTFAPRVTAGLISWLAWSGVRAGLTQMPSSAAMRDGDGREIPRGDLTDFDAPPNRLRPSYRYRPRRAWAELALTPFGSQSERAAPECIALLDAEWLRDSLTLELLASDGDRVGALRLVGRVSEWMEAITFAGAPLHRYPSGTGFVRGSSVDIDSTQLQLMLTS